MPSLARVMSGVRAPRRCPLLPPALAEEPALRSPCRQPSSSESGLGSSAFFLHVELFTGLRRNAFLYLKKYWRLAKGCEVLCVLNADEIFFLFNN